MSIKIIMQNNIAFLILAAGKGVRMGDATKHNPKPLLDLAGKPILSYLADYIRSNSPSSAVVTYGYPKDKWIDFIDQYDKYMDFVESKIYPSTIPSIIEFAMNVKEEHLVILNGDTVFDFQVIDDVVLKHIELQNDMTICMMKNNRASNYMEYMSNKNLLTHIRMVDVPIKTERSFIVVRRESLVELENKFSINLNSLSDMTYSYERFGLGITCLIDAMKFHNFKIFLDFFPDQMFNINTIQDLFFANQLFNEKTCE